MALDLTRKHGDGWSRESKALIYPAGSVAGYGLMRSLGLAGVPVVALSAKRCDSFYSRYPRERLIVPDPLQNHIAFVEWLADYGRRQDSRPVLFMAEDVYAYIVSAYQDQLAEHCLYPYLPVNNLERFFSKDIMLSCAERAGLAVPRWIARPTHDQLEGWQDFPAVVRPLVSRFTFKNGELRDVVAFPRAFGGKAIRANDRESLVWAAHAVEDLGIEYFVQKMILAPNSDLVSFKFVADGDHAVPSAFIGRKIRQHPADFGTCVVGRADYVDAVFDEGLRFVRESEYVGGGMIEFLWSEEDRRWYFIELNPRLDYWAGIAVNRGVNLPLQQYLLSTGQSLLDVRQRDGGRYWIDVACDLRALRCRRRMRDWPISVREMVWPYLYFNEAVFNWMDPMPGAFRLIRPCAGRAARWLLRRSRIRGQ